MKHVAGLALLMALTSCQLILGIEDKDAEIDAGAVDASVDAPTAFACDPVDQSGCDSGEKCASVTIPGSNPPVSETDCVPDGTVSMFNPCREVGGVDDCLAGLTCRKGLCVPICPVEPGSCGMFDTCLDSPDLFSDQMGDVGGCDPKCDPVFQDCEFQPEACYVNTRIGEPQCRPEPLPPAPLQEEACVADSVGCFVNSCAIGHGPHVATAAGNPPDHCAFYCTPADTHLQNSDFQFGDGETGLDCFASFKGTRPDGPGDRQCRFLQRFGVPNASPEIGVCVDTAVYGNCQECDIASQVTAAQCAPGCISQATFDDLPAN